MERMLSLMALLASVIALAVIAITVLTFDRCPANQAAVPASTTTVASTAPSTPSTTTTLPPTSTVTQPTTTPTAAPAHPVLSVGIDASEPDPNWTKPDLYVPRADPAYGTTVTRMTSASGTRFDRNTYSRRNPENADGSLFFTYHGDATYNVYRVADGQLVTVTTIHPDGDPQWHPTDPHTLRHLAGANSSAGDLSIYETDVITGDTTVLADLGPELRNLVPDAHYITDRAEGTPSRDGNRYGWLVYDQREEVVAVITYDLATGRIGGVLDSGQVPDGFVDFVSVSPSGRFVVMAGETGVYAYDYDLTNGRRIHDKAEHSDIALSATGDDVYVHVDFSAASPTAGWVVARNLVTGETSKFLDLYDDANTSIHFSGKAYELPGWVVVSTYDCKEDFAWSCQKVFALNIDSGQIVNLAHTYNCGEDYWTETHASANRDLTRVYFNSDGGSCGIDAEVYRIDVPALPD